MQVVQQRPEAPGSIAELAAKHDLALAALDADSDIDALDLASKIAPDGLEVAVVRGDGAWTRPLSSAGWEVLGSGEIGPGRVALAWLDGGLAVVGEHEGGFVFRGASLLAIAREELSDPAVLTDAKRRIYASLKPWETVEVARHPDRRIGADQLLQSP